MSRETSFSDGGRMTMSSFLKDPRNFYIKMYVKNMYIKDTGPADVLRTELSAITGPEAPDTYNKM
jgi:hypothetical protein